MKIMRSVSKNIILILMATFIAAGCGDKDKKGPADKQGFNPTVDTAPPKDAVLNYALQKNQKLTYKVTSTTNSTQSIVSDTAMSQNVKQTLTYIVDITVKDVDAEKIMELDVSMRSVSLNAESNGQKISYKSGNKTLSKEDKMRFGQYEAFVNTPFTIRLDPKGEILEVYHVDRIVNKYLDMQGFRDSVNQQQKKQLQTNIAEGELKPLIQQIFRSLPQKHVAKDSTWNFTYPAQLGVFTVENIAKYKLENFELLGDQRLAVIHAGLDIIPRGKTQCTERGINYRFQKPQASGDGKIYFNMAKGCVQRSNTSTTLKMSLTMTMPKTPRGPMKATRNDIMQTTNSVELL